MTVKLGCEVVEVEGETVRLVRRRGRLDDPRDAGLDVGVPPEQPLAVEHAEPAQPAEFEIGDTVDVHTKILEGNKERIQVFTGVVIARSGSGSREMFTVRRIVAGEGVERKFPLHSPRIDKVVVKRSSVVRRAKLYFLRDRVGKAVRLKERRTS